MVLPPPPPVAALVVRTAEQGPGLLWNPPPQAPAVRPRGTPPNSAGCQEQWAGWGGGGQAHSISKRGLLFRDTKYTRNPEQCPARALTGTPQLHPHTHPTHSHCEATSQPEAFAHGDSPPEWEAAREEAQAGLGSGLGVTGTGILGSLSSCRVHGGHRFQVGTTLASQTPHPEEGSCWQRAQGRSPMGHSHPQCHSPAAKKRSHTAASPRPTALRSPTGALWWVSHPISTLLGSKLDTPNTASTFRLETPFGKPP